MKIVSHWRVRCLAVVVLMSFANYAVEAHQNASAREEIDKSLKQFLQTLDNNMKTRYVVGFRDLNGDGMPEAIVYMIGNKWCGSGGCNTLILARDGDSWKIVANITITRPPVRVLNNTSNGWHSIAVRVQGGRIGAGYDAELTFNGKTYPKNPSIPPARHLKQETSGDVVITSTQDAIPLYEDR